MLERNMRVMQRDGFILGFLDYPSSPSKSSSWGGFIPWGAKYKFIYLDQVFLVLQTSLPIWRWRMDAYRTSNYLRNICHFIWRTKTMTINFILISSSRRIQKFILPSPSPSPTHNLKKSSVSIKQLLRWIKASIIRTKSSSNHHWVGISIYSPSPPMIINSLSRNHPLANGYFPMLIQDPIDSKPKRKSFSSQLEFIPARLPLVMWWMELLAFYFLSNSF